MDAECVLEAREDANCVFEACEDADKAREDADWARAANESEATTPSCRFASHRWMRDAAAGVMRVTGMFL